MKNLKWTAIPLALALAAIVPAAAFADTAQTPQQGLAAPQGLGDCFWSHVSEADKADFAATFHTAVAGGLSQHSADISHWVQQKNATWDQAIAQCDAHPKIPKRLSFALVAAQFEQYGAFHELADNAQITRDELDQTWAKAPEAARQCERAQAGMTLGGTTLTCPDTSALSWFVNDLRTRHTLDQRRDTLMVFSYMGDKARSEVAEAKIADFDKTGKSNVH